MLRLWCDDQANKEREIKMKDRDKETLDILKEDFKRAFKQWIEAKK